MQMTIINGKGRQPMACMPWHTKQLPVAHKNSLQITFVMIFLQITCSFYRSVLSFYRSLALFTDFTDHLLFCSFTDHLLFALLQSTCSFYSSWSFYRSVLQITFDMIHIEGILALTCIQVHMLLTQYLIWNIKLAYS